MHSGSTDSLGIAGAAENTKKPLPTKNLNSFNMCCMFQGQTRKKHALLITFFPPTDIYTKCKLYTKYRLYIKCECGISHLILSLKYKCNTQYCQETSLLRVVSDPVWKFHRLTCSNSQSNKSISPGITTNNAFCFLCFQKGHALTSISCAYQTIILSESLLMKGPERKKRLCYLLTLTESAGNRSKAGISIPDLPFCLVCRIWEVFTCLLSPSLPLLSAPQAFLVSREQSAPLSRSCLLTPAAKTSLLLSVLKRFIYQIMQLAQNTFRSSPQWYK